MLKVTVPEGKVFHPDTNTFTIVPHTTLTMEHSLLSVKKWESRWKVPFLGKQKKTAEQMLDYLQCMTLTKNVDPIVYVSIPEKEMIRITQYIKDPMTAMTIQNNLIGAQKSKDELVTAETIYYWMIALNIPIEFQKWHLESLLALIKFVNIKSDPKPKKLTKRQQIEKNAKLNEERWKQIEAAKAKQQKSK